VDNFNAIPGTLFQKSLAGCNRVDFQIQGGLVAELDGEIVMALHGEELKGPTIDSEFDNG
jgi:hypothetical protein